MPIDTELLRRLANQGAFDIETHKREAKLKASEAGDCVGWAVRRREYCELLGGLAPAAQDIVASCVVYRRDRYYYYGTAMRTSNIDKIARNLATITGLRPTDFIDVLCSLDRRGGTEERQASLVDNYVKLRNSRYNEVDRSIYEGLVYTETESGGQANGIQILRPTGNGKEYEIMGTCAEDLYDALMRMPAPTYNHIPGQADVTYDNRHQYLDALATHLITVAGGFEVQDASALAGVPATACDTSIRLDIVKEGQDVLGYKLSHKGLPPCIQNLLKFSFDAFKASMTPIPNPKPLSNDPDTPCYCYIDLNRWQEGNCDTWLEWFRTGSYPGFYEDNVRTVSAWLYASTLDNNITKQLLWMHGPGNDGKSPVLRAIQSVFGSKAGALDVSQDSDHASTQIVGKSLLTVSDQKNPNLARMGVVQKITGGDPIQVNPKYRDMYTYTAHAKILVAENVYPRITAHDPGQRSRILLVDIKGKTEEETIAMGIASRNADGVYNFHGDATFAAKIAEELPAFLALGRKHYESMGTTSQIPMSKQRQQLIAHRCVSREDRAMYDTVRNWFDQGPLASTCVQGDTVEQMLSTQYPAQWEAGNIDATKILTYLYRDGVQIKYLPDGDHIALLYTGIKLSALGKAALAGGDDDKDNGTFRAPQRPAPKWSK